MISYITEIDFDADGFWAGDDISGYVLDVSASIGITSPMDRVAQVGSLSLVVNNEDRRFSPSYTGGPLYGKLKPNLPVRVRATDGVTIWPLFRGVVRRFSPATGRYNERKARIECSDFLGLLQDYTISLPLQTDKRAGELLKLISAATWKTGVATGQMTLSGLPSAGDYVVVNGTTFTWAVTPSVANQVKIGATLEECVDNLCAAVNGEVGAGTLYGTGTVRPTDVTAAPNMTYYREVMRDNPVRYYRLGEPSGTNADDSGLNGRDATYNGGVTLGAAGALANDPDDAASFDGTDDYVSVPTLNLDGALSIEMWFKPDASPPEYQFPLVACYGAGYGAAGEDSEITYLIYDDAHLRFGYWDTSGGGVAGYLHSAAGSLTWGNWHHACGVYDSGTGVSSLYLNGALVDTDSIGHYTYPTPTTILLGRYIDGNFSLKGDLDELAIYWTPLSAARVAAHYAARAVAPGVTFSANARGAWGNVLTLTKSGANLAVSGATFSGGADGPAGLVDFEAGQQTFDVAADLWNKDSTNALTAASDVVHSEHGLLWAARDGTLTFRNRNHELVQASVAPVLALDGEFGDGAGGTEADLIFNRVVVSYTPRTTKASGVVAKSNSVVSVPGKWGTDRSNPTDSFKNPDGGSIVITLPFVDQTAGKITGAESLTLPLEAGVDYFISDQPDGITPPGAYDYTYNPSVKFTVAQTGSGVEVSLRNTALGPLYIRDLQVRGVPIVAYDQLQAVAEDAVSQTNYGRRAYHFDLPLTNDAQFAQALANYLLARYKDPAYRLVTIDFGARETVGAVNVYSVEIGDVIAVSDYQTGESAAKYLVTGMDYALSDAGGAVTFHVRRLDDYTVGIYDTGKYGQVKFGL